jgi:hypothetical protein
MNAIRFIVCLSLTMLLLLGICSIPVNAQGNCLPFSGTVHGALYRDAPGQPRYWHMVGHFTIGNDVYSATIAVKGTSQIIDGYIWQGNETWTFDFGGDNTIELMTDYVTEHMTAGGVTNPEGIFHIREVGIFANGTGAFKNAYGNLAADGPFGPNVVLHDTPKWWPSTGVAMFYVAPSQGTICGSNNRDKPE